MKRQQREGCNYEFVVDMEHENGQKEHRESKALEEKLLPNKFWDQTAELERTRKSVEKKTNLVLTSDKID